jgi:hypothetical protein
MHVAVQVEVAVKKEMATPILTCSTVEGSWAVFNLAKHLGCFRLEF